MKKIIAYILMFFMLVGLGSQIRAAEPLLPFAFSFIGKWDPTSNPLLLDDYGLQDVQNCRKVGKQFRGVPGHTPINTTLLSTYPYILNGFHFRKDQPQESHVIVYAADSTSPSAAVLYQNTTAIPNAGNFSSTILHTNSSVTELGRFASAPRGNMVYANGAETLIWGGNEIEATAFIVSSDSLTGSSTIPTSPNDFSDQIQNTRQTDDQIATINSGNYWLVGFYRPLQGVKYYIKTANVTTSTCSAWEWNGSLWSLISVTDGTSTGGKTLAQTGSMTFPSTVTTSKPRYINGLSLYWYQFHASAGSAAVYYTTVDAPIQAITNVWDGVEVKPAKFLVNTSTTYQDYTDQVIDDDETTFGVISSITSSGHMVAGFVQPQQAIDVRMVAGSENSETATLSLSYQAANAWATATAVSDGTANSAKSFGKSGVISFKPLDSSVEFKRPISDEVPLYYYKMSFNNTLSSTVRVAEIRGVPNPPAMATYKFAETFQSRSFLFDDKSGSRNKAVYSGSNTPDIFNGTDSGELYFGDNTALTAASTVFNVFLNGAIEQMIVTKKNETWRVSGDNPTNWNVQKMSSNIGCVAPLTMAKADTTDTGEDRQRQVVIWMSDKGVFMTDGGIIIPISDDIKVYFDPDDDRYIPVAWQPKSVAWYDPSIRSYKLLVASGEGSTYLNTELEYSLKYKEWTKIYRENTDGVNPLQSGWQVNDTTGTSYTYGGARLGDVYRLEDGYTWNGTNITQYLRTKDIILDTERPLFRKTTARNLITSYLKRGSAYRNLHSENSLQLINELGVNIVTEGNTITFTHYCDGGDATVNRSNNQVAPYYIPTANKNYDVQSVALGPCLYHSFKFEQTTNTLHGMEMTGMGVYYEPFTTLRN